jgi:hypothetical protein
MGVYPNPFIEKMDPAIQKLIARTKPVGQTAQQIPAMQGLPAGHPAIPGSAAMPVEQAVPTVANPNEVK